MELILLGTHAVFLGFSVLPIRSWIFYCLFCWNKQFLSASAGQTQAPTLAVLCSALSFIFSAATPVTIILAPLVSHIVIGRISFRLLFLLLECFMIDMYCSV